MKNRLSKIFLAAAICATALIPAKAFAIELGVGLASWFAWWNPVIEYYLNHTGKNQITVSESFTIDPNFLYGPIITISSGNWNLSTVYVFGRYRMSHSNRAYFPIMSAPYFWPGFSESSQDVWKHDLDATLSYRISDVIKFFVGFKYQHYSIDRSGGAILMVGATPYPCPGTGAMDFNGYGLGMGLSFTIPVGHNFYILWNVSAIGMLNIIRLDSRMLYLGYILPDSGTGYFISPGANTTLSLAYYIESASTTISLGFRYQYIHYLRSGGDLTAQVARMGNDNRDQFYGVMISAVYNFRFGN